jgi:DNA-binding FadR family transcriptional regulator
MDDAAARYRPGYEVAAERIIEYIVDRKLLPGDRLPTEQALAEELGYSRSVTREAIKTLTALGRVSAERGRGLFVASPTGTHANASFAGGNEFLPADPEQVEQLLNFRMVQESAAARFAARNATPPYIARLRTALESLDEAIQADDLDALAVADTEFHVGVALASRNQFLVSTVASARELQRQVVALALRGDPSGSLAQAQAEHRAIADAILRGDEDEAARQTEIHLGRTLVGYRATIHGLLERGE